MSVVSITYENEVALVRYDRGAKANALNLDAIEELTATATALGARTDLRAVVLSGTTTRFSAGVDLSDENLWRQDIDPVARQRVLAAGGRMCTAWSALPQVVIAAVEGPAIGGGGLLSLTADFRVMGKSAYFRFPEVRLGLTLGWGGLALLTSLVGPARAKHILFTDRAVAPAEALQIGLCEEVTDDGATEAAAAALAREVSYCPPLSVSMTKRAVDAECRANWAAPYEADQFYLAQLLRDKPASD